MKEESMSASGKAHLLRTLLDKAEMNLNIANDEVHALVCISARQIEGVASHRNGINLYIVRQLSKCAEKLVKLIEVYNRPQHGA